MHLILIGLGGFSWLLATLNVGGSIVLGLAALMAAITVGRWL